MHLLRPLSGEMQRQQRARGKTADDDHVAARAELVVRRAHRLVPILPARRIELRFGAAMAFEQRAVDGEAGTGQALSDKAQLNGRPAEAVDEEKSDAAILAEARLVVDQPLGDDHFVAVVRSLHERAHVLSY